MIFCARACGLQTDPAKLEWKGTKYDIYLFIYLYRPSLFNYDCEWSLNFALERRSNGWYRNERRCSTVGVHFYGYLRFRKTISSLIFIKSPICGHFFVYFRIFKLRDSNSDCQRRRLAYWPLDQHHHGPKIEMKKVQVTKCKAILILESFSLFFSHYVDNF